MGCLHQPDTCTKEREKCVRVARALAAANRFILEKPAEALEILKKRFDKMDQEVLVAAWKMSPRPMRRTCGSRCRV